MKWSDRPENLIRLAEGPYAVRKAIWLMVVQGREFRPAARTQGYSKSNVTCKQQVSAQIFVRSVVGISNAVFNW